MVFSPSLEVWWLKSMFSINNGSVSRQHCKFPPRDIILRSKLDNPRALVKFLLHLRKKKHIYIYILVAKEMRNYKNI